MRKHLSIIPACLLFLFVSACTASKPAATEDNYRPTATIKDIMDSVVDKGADYIWDSVSSTVDERGVTDKQPRTDDEWKEVRRHAIMLVEGTNLLLMPGRHVAKAGEKADDPKIELGPEQIQELIDKDRDSWVKHAHNLHDKAMVALAAIDKKDVDGLFMSGDAIDKACEDCHLQYWYPNERKPEAAASEKK